MEHPYDTKIVLDGNDGTGKSSLAVKLKELGFRNVSDRGLPTKMTDDAKLRPGPEHDGEVYVLLDAPVDVCRARLGTAGKDLTERYHTVADLTYYRQRYQEVAAVLGVELIDSTGTPEVTLAKVMYFLGEEWAKRNITTPGQAQQVLDAKLPDLPKMIYCQGASVTACDSCSNYVCPCIVKRLGDLERTLKWYAWPDRYSPRFEGVGHAGAGGKFYSSVDTDCGRMAQGALGLVDDPEYERGVKMTEEMLAKIRKHVPPVIYDLSEAGRAEREGRT
jgi:hypothetical protein